MQTIKGSLLPTNCPLCRDEAEYHFTIEQSQYSLEYATYFCGQELFVDLDEYDCVFAENKCRNTIKDWLKEYNHQLRKKGPVFSSLSQSYEDLARSYLILALKCMNSEAYRDMASWYFHLCECNMNNAIAGKQLYTE